MAMITVLPNFTVLVQNKEVSDDISHEVILAFFQLSSESEDCNVYSMNDESVWLGMNYFYHKGLVDFKLSEFLFKISPQCPVNVREAILGWETKFGVIKYVGGDCFIVTDANVLEQMRNLDKLKGNIYEAHGSCVLIRSLHPIDVAGICRKHLGYPVLDQFAKNYKVLVLDDSAMLCREGDSKEIEWDTFKFSFSVNSTFLSKLNKFLNDKYSRTNFTEEQMKGAIEEYFERSRFNCYGIGTSFSELPSQLSKNIPKRRRE